ncbi:Integrase, catalytic core protein [Phytophthora megakarya]|uniref:Integrase, catalytic core protein n=1 Tax=Phytophthora megakarya TaxID=4795 RepID=A0A225WK70_9STRA|nr:Integrase, catalytic core protein [Phytophthora megakarya]
MYQTGHRVRGATPISVLRDPGLKHWRATIRVLRYLMTTPKHEIVYKKQKNGFKVKAFTDDDWVSTIDSRRSVSGIMMMIGNASVVFKSMFQRTIALSSAEADYMAISLCVQEIWEDNQGAIELAKNAGYHSRTRHVDIKHHFTSEIMERGTIKVDHIDTKRQLADLLTTALGTKTLKYLSNASGIKMKITAQ